MAELRQIKNNTFVIEDEGNPCIPVYFLDEKNVVLLDSGYDYNRKTIEELTEEQGIHVRAIIGSHTHYDHNGSHSYFKAKYGSEIIMRDIEAAVCQSFQALTLRYGPSSADELKEIMPYMICKGDRIFSEEDKELYIDDARFELIPLPGHTVGHTGIAMPDGILYVGDSLLTENGIRYSKVLTILNWQNDLATKAKLKTLNYDGYILAHGGYMKEIRELVDINVNYLKRRAETMYEYMSERACWTEEELTKACWTDRRMKLKSPLTKLIFKRNIMCEVEYLRSLGKIDKSFEDGIFLYKIK